MPRRRAGQELTEKEELFVEHLLADPKRNKTLAAKKAGYAKKNAHITANKNLNKPNIKMAIDKKLAPIKKKLSLDRDYIIENLHHLVETCKQSESDHFDPSAVNRSLELLMKALGLFTDKIQLDANVNNKHSVDMVRILEADTTSQDAFALLMERKRSERLIGANDGD